MTQREAEIYEEDNAWKESWDRRAWAAWENATVLGRYVLESCAVKVFPRVTQKLLKNVWSAGEFCSKKGLRNFLIMQKDIYFCVSPRGRVGCTTLKETGDQTKAERRNRATAGNDTGIRVATWTTSSSYVHDGDRDHDWNLMSLDLRR